MDDPPDHLKEVDEKTEELSVHLFGVALKTLFLIGFLFINFVAQPWIERFEPEGLLERIEFRTMQVLFAIFTVVPLFMIVYRDLRILYIRSKKRIEAEEAKK